MFQHSKRWAWLLALVLGFSVRPTLAADAPASEKPAAAAPAAEQPALVQAKDMHKVFGDGRHNAFTTLAKFKDSYWLAFRTAKEHTSADGTIVVLNSADGKTWREATRIDTAPDDRDPQFLVMGDKLRLYIPALKGQQLTTYCVSTTDGQTWTKPLPVYLPQYILWKPVEFGGKVYAAAHKRDDTNDGKNREVHLIESTDGLLWKKVSTIRGGKWESETTLRFNPDGHAIAYLRQKYGAPPAQILESDPPYTEWKARVSDINHFSGHCMASIDGVNYLLSRTMDYSTKPRVTSTMIYCCTGDKLVPYCDLRTGGDCAYAGAVPFDADNMLVSFYSSHEGAANIYTALVPLKKK